VLCARIGHALALVKAQQDLKQTTKVMTSSEKNGYRKRPRKVYGSAETLNSKPLPKAVEMPVSLKARSLTPTILE